MSEATTRLFGLQGVRVVRVDRGPDGKRIVYAVTADPDAARCRSCGVVSSSVMERTVTSPKDLPYSAYRIVVRRARGSHRRNEFTPTPTTTLAPIA